MRLLVASWIVQLGCLAALHAADWPQFLGPGRDGASAETGLALNWPKDGPPVLWQLDIGTGFSGPVIAGDRLVLFHRVGNKEVVECLDAATGKERWKFPYPTAYRDDFGFDNGPRATPTITGNRVFTLGAEGWLHCLDLPTGKVVWGRNVNTDYDVRKGFFGVGTSPLVEGDLVLVNVGGKENEAGIVAFDKESGKEVWKATNHEASYASPVAATVNGERLAFLFTREGIVILEPKTGKIRFTKRWRARINASVNAATPIVVGDLVFFSTCYNTGAILLQVGKENVKEIWSNDESMSNHYGTCVHRDGYLYGIDGRQEEGARLRCVELKTGKVMWSKDRFGCGALILADGHLLILDDTGELVVVEATPEAYREKARATVLSAKDCRAQIALSNGRLYGRDGKRLVCWKVTKD